jgi:anti-sigma28 factor (negative regulator of flagellin synthesis)
MKIGDHSDVGPSGRTGRRGMLPVAPPRALGHDVAELAETARELTRQLGRMDDASDPARAAQVAILRNAVASGRYQPDLREVARKLLVDVAAEPRP